MVIRVHIHGDIQRFENRVAHLPQFREAGLRDDGIFVLDPVGKFGNVFGVITDSLIVAGDLRHLGQTENVLFREVPGTK